jgi:cytochrome c oxidase subunit 3
VPTGEEHTKEWWAIVYLIATEFMLFVAGFVAFFDLDVLHAPGAPRSFVELNRPLTLVASLILWSSGVTAHLASRRTTGHRNAWLAATMALGLVFLGYQAHEYLRLYGEGFTLQSGPWGSLFYALTGLHGFHVIVGLVALAMLFVPRAKPATSAIVLYWHFVDAMWILIYGIVYLKVVP